MTRANTALLATALLAASVLAIPTTAQLRSPADFLGYELGDRFTPHHRVVDYVQHVAQNSPNVVLEEYGRTYEERPLLLAYVSTPDNIANLEAIRTDNLARAGLDRGSARGGNTPSSASIGNGGGTANTSLVWLSYNVHGNESVSTEAAMQTLFDLADPNNNQTQEWLSNTVVLLDPCINPDGRERYVQWYNRTAGAFVNPNPADWTHAEPWPGGRTNHYFFDLNRDWAWGSQVETRQRLVKYNAWMPHVHVDFHEQGVNEPYYFAPAAEPFHEDITDWQREFQKEVGRNNARYFDANSWLYFTKQRYDLFYPGYGDTWPMYNGAIGMTYEQGGSGRAGLGIETAEGDTLTLADRIAHHYTTGLSTVEVASRNADRLVSEFASFFRPTESSGAVVVRASASADHGSALRALLDVQALQYHVVDRTSTIAGRDYLAATEGRHAVAPGDLVVLMDQPKSTLAKVLLEPDATLADSLTYDMTSWSLPLLYGMDAVMTTASNRLSFVPAVPQPAAVVIGDVQRPYAYLAPFGSLQDHRFLAALHFGGIRVRMAHENFATGGRSFERGTLIVTRTGNERMGDRFDAVVRSTASRFGRELFAVRTGFVDEGPDLGSSDVAHLKAPRIALIGGDEVSSSSLGQIWHYFDERIAYPVTIINGSSLSNIEMGDFDILVLPSGNYRSTLGENRLEAVRGWVQRGGKIIAVDGGARFLAGKSGFGLKMKERPGGGNGDSADSTTVDPSTRPYAERERRRVSDSVVGAFYAAAVDPTHPLGYGLPKTFPVLRSTSSVATPLARGWNVGVLKSGEPVSGFAGHKTATILSGSLAFGVEDVGRGTVVYLMDDPLFRGMWYAGAVVFGNAVFAAGTD